MKETFGNLTITTEIMPKRGNCLKASAEGNYILMDYCGMNPMLVPDGTNAYFFGNKLIFVTRWSDMSEEEMETVKTGELCLAILPYNCVQFCLKVGENWGNVMVNLYHCVPGWNDESRPVDEIIFIFSDTHDSDFVISRSVKLPESLQGFFQTANSRSRKALAMEGELDAIRAESDRDASRDFYDYLYDACYDRTKQFARAAIAQEPDEIPGGIYVEITGDNRIVRLYQKDGDNSGETEMSSEVKLYYELAEKGIAEGQYNLGYCYENGDGVRQDYDKAVYWYKKAAEQDYAKAKYNLGVCIYNGNGAEEDHEEAVKWFLAAAEQGDMYAQFNMGVCLYKGDGIKQNMFEAIRWFEKAADQGHANAKAILGRT